MLLCPPGPAQAGEPPSFMIMHMHDTSDPRTCRCRCALHSESQYCMTVALKVITLRRVYLYTPHVSLKYMRACKESFPYPFQSGAAKMRLCGVWRKKLAVRLRYDMEDSDTLPYKLQHWYIDIFKSISIIFTLCALQLSFRFIFVKISSTCSKLGKRYINT